MRRVISQIFLYAFLIVLCIVIIYPFWYIVMVSIMPYQEYLQATRESVLLWPRQVTFEAYQYVLTQADFAGSMSSTVIITLVGTVMSMATTILASYALSKRHLKGRRFFTYFFFFTMLFSGGIIPLYLVVRSTRLLNTLWACMVPNLINTYYLLIMRSFFQEFPESLIESAKIEGSSELGTLVRIVLPLSMPVLAAVGLFYAVDRWNEFYFGLIFIKDNAMQPLQVMLYRLIKPGGNQFLDVNLTLNKIVLETVKMAAVVVTVVPILCVYPFLQKHFAKGVMLGAVKG